MSLLNAQLIINSSIIALISRTLVTGRDARWNCDILRREEEQQTRSVLLGELGKELC